jgi:PhnB protein
MAMKTESRSQGIVPYLLYDDAPAALEFLAKAFGFRRRFRMAMPDGRIGHAEMELEGDRIMLASAFPEMGFASPRALPGVHGQVWCRVPDVDAHFARAKEAGATVLGEPVNEHGQRAYRASDPEGHRWIFSQPAGRAAPKASRPARKAPARRAKAKGR